MLNPSIQKSLETPVCIHNFAIGHKGLPLLNQAESLFVPENNQIQLLPGDRDVHPSHVLEEANVSNIIGSNHRDQNVVDLIPLKGVNSVNPELLIEFPAEPDFYLFSQDHNLLEVGSNHPDSLRLDFGVSHPLEVLDDSLNLRKVVFGNSVTELLSSHIYELAGEPSIGEYDIRQSGVQPLIVSGYSTADSAIVKCLAGEISENRVHPVLGVEEEDPLLVAWGLGDPLENGRIPYFDINFILDDRWELLVIADYNKLAGLWLESSQETVLRDLRALVHNH